MKRLFFILFAIVLTTNSYATKSENELSKLFIGMSIKDFKSIFGDPSYSKYEKDTKTRMLLYNLYKVEGRGFAEYHFYFVGDSLTEVINYKDKSEIRYPLEKLSPETLLDEDLNFKIEGKSIVVSKIIEGISINNEQIRNALLVAISRACNGSSGEVKLNEPTRVLYHGIIDKIITFDWIWGSINVFYSIDVAIKEGRIRIKVIGEEIDWHQDKQKATYYFSETYPVGQKVMKAVPNEKAREMIRLTIHAFEQYISVIEEELHKVENDDW